jgi:uncharacterized protein (DUF362 family)
MISRRTFLHATAGLGAATLTGWPRPAFAQTQPEAAVGLARCDTYEFEAVHNALGAALDRIGGIDTLVGGKTVTIKPNLVGEMDETFNGISPQRSYQIHSMVALALAHLVAAAGASRIRFVESLHSRASFATQLGRAGWDVSLFTENQVGAPLEFQDTRNLGSWDDYAEFPVPGGGLIFPAFHLNRAYTETDVFISLAKMKEHQSAGVTLSMKNLFGAIPLSLYSNNAGTSGDENATSYLDRTFHWGSVDPAEGVPTELDPTSSREDEVRVPRIIVDVASARPIDLAVIDAIETIRGAEGPWGPDVWHDTPGLLLVGRNPVATDAVAMDFMGHDPAAPDYDPPFKGINHVALAAAQGLGTNDLSRIDVREVGVDGPRSALILR